jgi:hypothetical protein
MPELNPLYNNKLYRLIISGNNNNNNKTRLYMVNLRIKALKAL